MTKNSEHHLDQRDAFLVRPDRLPPSPAGPRRPRRSALRPVLVASLVLAVGPAGAATLGPAPASAAGVLEQTQGSGSGTAAPRSIASQSPSSSASKGAPDLDVAPDWNAPGIRQATELIGWAKAGAVVFGVLGLIGGVVIGKVLKESGSHHASGVRATAIGIGGALVLAGAAPEIVPWLMG